MVDFKSKAAYGKWLAYGHMHDKFHGKEPVSIRGEKHKVDHSKKYSDKEISKAREMSK